LSWDKERLLVHGIEPNDKTEPGWVSILPIPDHLAKKTPAARPVMIPLNRAIFCGNPLERDPVVREPS
jgi:hypothetical protein